MNPLTLLNDAKVRLSADFALFPVIATEIEFYLHGAGTRQDMPEVLNEIYATAMASGVALHTAEKERGLEQYEFALHPGKDPVRIAQDTDTLKEIITQVAAHHGMQADFSARPLTDQPGSGLHVHVHLINGKGENVFFKEDDSYSETLMCALGGLLVSMKESMPFFASDRKSYARFVPGYNVPVTVSWGANNRTVAVRLPTKPAGNKHIEHRVSGADAEPALVMAAILSGIHYGILHRVHPGEQIFGDASLPLYALEPLPRDIKSSVACLQQAKVLPGYFGRPFCEEYIREMLKA